MIERRACHGCDKHAYRSEGARSQKKRSAALSFLAFVLLLLSLAAIALIARPCPAFADVSDYPVFDGPVSSNGTTLESFSASWSDGSDSLTLTPQRYDEKLFATYTVSFALSGSSDHAADSIVLEIPTEAFAMRDGGSFTYVDMPISEAPGETEDYPYNYTIDEENDRIVISNYKTVPASYQVTMSFVYRYSPIESGNDKHTTLDLIGDEPVSLSSSINVYDAGIHRQTESSTLTVSTHAEVKRVTIFNCLDYSEFPLEAINVTPPANPDEYIYAWIYTQVYFDYEDYTQDAQIIATIDTGTEHAVPIASGYSDMQINGAQQFDELDCGPILKTTITAEAGYLGTNNSYILDQLAFLVAIDKSWIEDSIEVSIDYKVEVSVAETDTGAVSTKSDVETANYIAPKDEPTGNLFSLYKYHYDDEDPAVQAILSDVSYTSSYYKYFTANCLNLTTPDGTFDYDAAGQRFYTVEFIDDHLYLEDGTRLKSGDYYFSSIDVDNIEAYNVSYKWGGGGFKYTMIDEPDPERISIELLIKCSDDDGYEPLLEYSPDGSYMIATLTDYGEEHGFTAPSRSADVHFDNADGLEVTGYKVRIKTSYPAISLGEEMDGTSGGMTFDHITFKPSETMKEFVSEPEKFPCSVYNVNTLNIVDDTGALIGVTREQGNQTIPSVFSEALYADDVSEFGEEMYHGNCAIRFNRESPLEYDLGSSLNKFENDAAGKRVKARYRIDLTTSYTTISHKNGEIEQEFLDFLVDIGFTSYLKWRVYDLLPSGAFLDVDELDTDTLALVDQIPNYKGTGRTLVVLDYDNSDNNQNTIVLTATGINQAKFFYIPIVYPYSSVADYGTMLENTAAIQVLEGGFNGTGNTDNGGDLSIADIMSDLDGNGSNDPDADDFLYAESTDEIAAPSAAELALSKSAKTTDMVSWSAPNDDVPVQLGGDYSYRLHFGSQPDTVTKDMVLYDNIEQFEGSGWRGTLESVDATQPERYGIAPVVYYSTQEGIDFEAHPVDDSAVWSETPPADMSEVKAIAVDMRKNADGTEASLGSEKTISIILNMSAPDTVDGIEDVSAPSMNAVSLSSRIESAYGTGASQTSIVEYDHTSVSLDAAMLTVSKETEGRAPDGYAYSFAVKRSDGSPIDTGTAVGEGVSEDGAFSIEAGGSKTIAVPSGEYIVEEMTSADDIAALQGGYELAGLSSSVAGGSQSDGSASPAITLDKGGSGSVSFLNSFSNATLSVKAVDADTGEPVQGASFVLSAADGGVQAGEQMTTGQDGKSARVECADASYSLSQSSLPDGYVAPLGASTSMSVSISYEGGSPSSSVSPAGDGELAGSAAVAADADGNMEIVVRYEKRAPALSLEKSAVASLSGGQAAAGAEIAYSFVATNTGNTDLSGIEIEDDLDGISDISFDWSSSADGETLSPGESVSATASYALTQADVDAGAVSNTARATGSDPDGGGGCTSPDSMAETSIDADSSLSLAKTSDPSSVVAGDAHAGYEIEYSFEVENTGAATLGSITVSDPMLGEPFEIDLPEGGLAPGAKASASKTYALTQKDIDRGLVSNAAVATGVPSGGGDPVSDEAETETGIARDPSLSVSKKAGVDSLSGDAAKAGTEIRYTISVVNDGNTTIRIPDGGVTDDLEGAAPLSPEPKAASLAPGASLEYETSYVLTQADVDAGRVVNTATAVGTDPDGGQVEGEGSATVEVSPEASLSIEKSVSASPSEPGGCVPGASIDYLFVVENTGNTTVSGVSIDDSMPDVAPSFDWASSSDPTTGDGVLSPGETVEATGTHALTQEDIDARDVSNTATATGEAPDGSPVSSEPDEAALRLPAAPHISLDKSVDSKSLGGDEAAVGRVLTYSFEAVNDGQVTLSGVRIDDALLGGQVSVDWDSSSDPSTGEGVLSPGETVKATAGYELTQADIDAGSRANDAKAVGTPPAAYGDVPVEGRDGTTTSIEGMPSVSIDVSVDMESVVGDSAKAGTVLAYTFVVTNTGSLTLSGTEVASSLESSGLSDIEADLSSLPDGGAFPPGASFTAHASYTLTQDDIDAGAVENVASALANGSNGMEVSDDDSVLTSIAADPSAALVKEASAESIEGAAAGDAVEYSFRLANDGNVSLSGVYIEDDLEGLSDISYDWSGAASEGVLSPGEEITGTASYELTQGDVDACVIVNTARIVAAPPGGEPGVVSEDAESVVDLVPSDALELSKTADVESIDGAQAGDEIRYSFAVSNAGTSTVRGVEIEDSMDGLSSIEYDWSSAAEEGRLAPGETVTAQAVYKVTDADVSAGIVSNTARAVGEAGDGGRPIESAEATYDVALSAPGDPTVTPVPDDGGDGPIADAVTALSKTGSTGLALAAAAIAVSIAVASAAVARAAVKRRGR